MPQRQKEPQRGVARSESTRLSSISGSQAHRCSQLKDEEEHAELFERNRAALLKDTLKSLRDRMADMEQDNWKYDRGPR
jgi:hypothetical protein